MCIRVREFHVQHCSFTLKLAPSTEVTFGSFDKIIEKAGRFKNIEILKEEEMNKASAIQKRSFFIV